MSKHVPKNEHISHSKPDVPPIHSQESALGAVARVFWMLAGNAILLFTALGIFQRHAAFLSVSLADLIYWVTVLGLVVIRYCDIKYLGGLTAKGEPASITHWQRYVKFLLLMAAGLWLCVRLLAVLTK